MVKSPSEQTKQCPQVSHEPVERPIEVKGSCDNKGVGVTRRGLLKTLGISVLVSPLLVASYLIKKDHDEKQAKIAYEKKHAYDLTAEEVTRLISIRNKHSQFGSEEEVFLSFVNKRLDNITSDPRTAYSRLYGEDKKDFDRFSSDYDRMIKNHDDFLNDLKLVKEKYDKLPSVLGTLVAGAFLVPFTLGLDFVTPGEGLPNTDSLGNAVLNQIEKKDLQDNVDIEKLYDSMCQKKEKFEKEKELMRRYFKNPNHQFDFNTNSSPNTEIDKLLYFFYSSARPTLIHEWDKKY